MGKAFCLVKVFHIIAYVQPTLIKTERFHLVGVVGINFSAKTGKSHIKWIVGRNYFKIWTNTESLPQRLGCFHTCFCGYLVCRQHNAVPFFNISSDSHGQMPDFGPVQTFYRGKKFIAIYMKYYCRHRTPPLPNKCSQRK